MYHRQLDRQIKKYLVSFEQSDPQLIALLKAVSQSYQNYERDQELSEHAFSINELEYQTVNQKLKELTQDLTQKVKERTAELEDLAQFPLENPNPIFRVDTSGKIIFKNHSAEPLKNIVFEGKKYTISQFFKSHQHLFKDSGNFDLHASGKQYILFYKKIKGKKYFNFYGADVTEKNKLREQAQDNFVRLSNFLETTDDAYYIIYGDHKEKNLVTSRWKNFFGFDAKKSKDIFKDKSACVLSENQQHHYDRIRKLKVGNKISIRYKIANKTTGDEFWLSEVVSKYYDLMLDDIVISGRITDITKEHLFSMQVHESEKRFRNLMEVIPVMVWVSNENNKVVYSNKALKNFLGTSLENLGTQRDYLSYVHPDDKKMAIESWVNNFNNRKSTSSEYRLRSKSGKFHYIYEKATPRFLEDGSFAGYVGAFFDLTKEKEFQQEISLEKEKLEILTDHSPDIIILTNENGTIEYVSPTAKRMLGYKESEMIGRNLSAFMCRECSEGLSKMNWLATLKKGYGKFEYRMQSRSGKLIWVESVLSVVNDAERKNYKLLMHNRDIDTIKKAEFSLMESEQKYRGLFENMHLGVMEVDLDEHIQWVNKSFEKISGYTLKQLKGKSAVDVFIADTSSNQLINKVKRSREERSESIYEIQMKNKKGDLIDVVISGSPIVDLQGKVRGSVGIHWDVTEIRKMEKMLEEEQANRQREIMRATINAEEQQREVLGNELHDGVGHILTYTSLFLQMASNSDKLSPELFNKAHFKVEEALKEVRRISRTLVPPALIDLGLKEAVIELLNQFSDINDIRFNFVCKQQDLSDIHMNAQRNIYRIIQELLNNTIKHARATEVKITIKRTLQKLIIQYYNNGKPFNQNRVKKGLGLNSISNRAYFYNGSIQIESNKTKGTNFNIELPIENILKNE